MISKIIKIFLRQRTIFVKTKLPPSDKIFLNMEPFCPEPQLPPRGLRPATDQPEPLPDHSFESDDGEAWSQFMLAIQRPQKPPKEPPESLCILDSESERENDEEESEPDSLRSKTSEYRVAVVHRRPHLLICLA